MGEALLESLPLALGIAASPFPVVPAVLLLFSPRPRAAGGGFLVGWFGALLAATALAAAVSSAVERSGESPTWASWVRVVLAGLLFLVAARQWRSRGKAEEPGWMRTLGEATPAAAARLGVLLSVANPKVLVLALAGGLSIGAADLAVGRTVVTLLLFTVLASVSVALPWLLHLLRGDRILGPLGRVRDWLVVHNAVVVAVVLLVLGVLLLLEGLTGLRGGA